MLKINSIYSRQFLMNDRIPNLRNQISFGAAQSEIAGPCGSVFIPADAEQVAKWSVTNPHSTNDRFIKRMDLAAPGRNGEVKRWTMVTRGTEKSVGNVSMIIPVYTAPNGEKSIIFQEEARPIHLFRNGQNSRLLAFPAGVIGDETKFSSESAMDCAVREFGEETGMKIKRIIPLNKEPIMSSPGLTDEATHFFFAEVESLKLASKPVTDGGVTRGWWRVPLRNLEPWIKAMENQNKNLTSQTYTGIAKAIFKGLIRK